MYKHLATGQTMHLAVQLHPAMPTVSRRKLVLKEQNEVTAQSSCCTVLHFLAISQWNITLSTVVSGSFLIWVQDLTHNSKEKEVKDNLHCVLLQFVAAVLLHLHNIFFYHGNFHKYLFLVHCRKLQMCRSTACIWNNWLRPLLTT